MKAVVAAFNQEKALVGAFSVITNLRMELFEALYATHRLGRGCVGINLIFEAPFVAEKSLLSAFLLADLCEASRDVRL